MHVSFHERLHTLEERLQKLEGRYRRYLKEEKRMRERARDVHLTSRDEGVLIQAFAIGGIVEKLFEVALAKALRP